MSKGNDKAFAYLRVSGKGQIAGDGFPRQAETINRYARMNGVEIVDTFRDEGVSGTKELADREGLAALLERIDGNGVRTVVVERADRIARDLVVGEIILGQFRERGVKVIEAEDGNDLTAGDNNPTSKLIRQVLGAIAEFEKSVIVHKLRAARERARKNNGGVCEGRKPYGTRPGESAVIERILSMRRAKKGQERTSFADIATALNDEQVTTRQGNPWQPGTVYKIVKDHAKHLTAAKGD